MILKDMKSLLEFYIDDVADTPIAVQLFNAAKERMATEVSATFPDIVANGALDDSFIFDDKYHEIPVYYAAAMYKAADSSIMEKNSFLQQFEGGILNFVENYDPPVTLRVGPGFQQFTATDGQLEFTVTNNDYNHLYGNLQVYFNGKETHDYTLQGDDGRTITLYPLAEVVAGDKVTAQWELNSNFVTKPAFYPKGW